MFKNLLIFINTQKENHICTCIDYPGKNKKVVCTKHDFQGQAGNVLYAKSWKEGLECENSTDYLKNNKTKHRHVCTHFDAFSIMIPTMGIQF